MRWASVVLLLAASAQAAEESFKGVMVLPPVVTVPVGKKTFVGVDTRKTTERFDLPAHPRLVKAFDAKLEGKVLPADVAQGVLTKEGATAPTLDKPGVLERVAAAAHVQWLVRFTLSRSGLLTAQVLDSGGKAVGDSSFLSDVGTLSDAQAASLAGVVVPKLLALEKARLDAIAEAARRAEAEKPPPVEELVDSELEQMKVKQAPKAAWAPDRNRVRAWVAIGPGATLRGLELSGDAVPQLAELDNGTVVGLGVAAQLLPLELFDATAGRAWSQLSLEVHYRRAFVQARGVSGGLEGETCSMTDDDLQLRAGWRYRLGDGYLPTIGLAGGWSQEQTHFQCSLPLVSTTWRGVDAQLRVRQPLYRDLVTLELVGGPRFLLPGPLASQPGFSLSGEAWVEVKPVSVLFARAGARASRLVAANPSLSATDTRAFFSVELGAFF